MWPSAGSTIVSDNVQNDGSEQVIWSDGTTQVTDAAGNNLTYDPNGNLVSNEGVSLASQPPSPPVQPTNAPTSNALALTSFANAAGAFGVSIASLLTGRPVVTNPRTGAVATSGAYVQPQFNIGALLLLGLGVLILVKVLK